jgi:predicted dienelactone hydrolase
VLVPRTRAQDYPVVSAQQGGDAGVSLPLVAMATGPKGPASDEEATALAQHRLGKLLGRFASWTPPRPTASSATRTRSRQSERC